MTLFFVSLRQKTSCHETQGGCHNPLWKRKKNACKYRTTCYPESIFISVRVRLTAMRVMLVSLFITGVLGGITALLLFDVIGEARGSHDTLKDRYHE